MLVFVFVFVFGREFLHIVTKCLIVATYFENDMHPHALNTLRDEEKSGCFKGRMVETEVFLLRCERKQNERK